MTSSSRTTSDTSCSATSALVPPLWSLGKRPRHNWLMTPYQYLAVVTGFQYRCNLKWISVRLSTFLLAASQWDELLITGSFLRECMCVSSVSVCGCGCVYMSAMCVFCELHKLPIALRDLDTKAAKRQQFFLMRRWEDTHTQALADWLTAWACFCEMLRSQSKYLCCSPTANYTWRWRRHQTKQQFWILVEAKRQLLDFWDCL